MKFLAVLSLAAVAFADINIFKRNCAGNNCNRQITGTNGKPASTIRQSDCASFQLTVVTPSPVISVTYIDEDVSISSTVFPNSAVTSVPTAQPTYATMCSASGQYASACSCWGFTGSVSTAPTPTYTVTSVYDFCDL